MQNSSLTMSDHRHTTHPLTGRQTSTWRPNATAPSSQPNNAASRPQQQHQQVSQGGNNSSTDRPNWNLQYNSYNPNAQSALQQRQQHQEPAPPPSLAPLITITNPQDVLLGRGRGHKDQQGNKLYHELVAQHVEAYNGTTSRRVKNPIVTSIVDAILAQNGRFLQPVPPPYSTGWTAVPYKTACVKTSQALRYKHRTENKTLDNSDSELSSGDDYSRDDTKPSAYKSFKPATSANTANETKDMEGAPKLFTPVVGHNARAELMLRQSIPSMQEYAQGTNRFVNTRPITSMAPDSLYAKMQSSQIQHANTWQPHNSTFTSQSAPIQFDRMMPNGQYRRQHSSNALAYATSLYNAANEGFSNVDLEPHHVFERRAASAPPSFADYCFDMDNMTNSIAYPQKYMPTATNNTTTMTTATTNGAQSAGDSSSLFDDSLLDDIETVSNYDMESLSSMED